MSAFYCNLRSPEYIQHLEELNQRIEESNRISIDAHNRYIDENASHIEEMARIIKENPGEFDQDFIDQYVESLDYKLTELFDIEAFIRGIERDLANLPG